MSDLKDCKREIGRNLFHFWIFKCFFTPVVVVSILIGWPLASYMMSTILKYKSFSDLFIPILPTCLVFLFVVSLAGAFVRRTSLKSLNRFIEKVDNGKPIPYHSYKENGYILHRANYDGKVLVKSRGGVREIEFN